LFDAFFLLFFTAFDAEVFSDFFVADADCFDADGGVKTGPVIVVDVLGVVAAFDGVDDDVDAKAAVVSDTLPSDPRTTNF
jgi:hypothetical protein